MVLRWWGSAGLIIRRLTSWNIGSFGSCSVRGGRLAGGDGGGEMIGEDHRDDPVLQGNGSAEGRTEHEAAHVTVAGISPKLQILGLRLPKCAGLPATEPLRSIRRRTLHGYSASNRQLRANSRPVSSAGTAEMRSLESTPCSMRWTIRSMCRDWFGAGSSRRARGARRPKRSLPCKGTTHNPARKSTTTGLKSTSASTFNTKYG